MRQKVLLAIVGAALLAVSPTHGKDGKKGKESGEKGGTADINIGVGELKGGNPDRPLIRGSVPNPQGNDAKKSKDAVVKGKKILQN